MNKSVNARAREIATFRFVSVWLMETAARWTPITAEMEAKVMLGRHIWDFAQMADVLGKRTFELRQAAHYTLPPSDDYTALLQQVAAQATLETRIAALYQGLLPGLAARYRAYIAAGDAILDEPSIVIMERIVRDLERQMDEAAQLQRELGLAPGGGEIAARERGVGAMLDERLAA